MTNTEHTQGRILDMEKYNLNLKLKDQGIKSKEDKTGKTKIWIRMNKNLAPKARYDSTCKILFFPAKEQT